MNSIVYAPATGRLEALPLGDIPSDEAHNVAVDIEAEIGDEVLGPERTFATPLAEITVTEKNLRRARALSAAVLNRPVLVASGGPARSRLAQDG